MKTLEKSLHLLAACILGLTFVALCLMPVDAFAAETQNFGDVPEAHPFAASIKELKEQSFVVGYPDGTFAPDNSISRAEFVTMVIAATAENPSGENCFEDVATDWYAKFVCAAKSKGLVSGYPDGTFRPARNINLAEASTVLARAYKLNPKKPKTSEPWYKPFVEELEAQSAIPTTIDYMDRRITRAEMAEMTLRLKSKIKNRPAKTYESLATEFPRFDSCGELKEKLAAFSSSREAQYNRGFYVEDMAMPLTAAPTSAAKTDSAQEESAVEPSGGGGGETDYSSTNVQVEGVDEADIIKNDGEFIYIVSRNIIRVVKAYPPGEMAQIAELKFDDENFNPNEIYIAGNNLIVLGSTYTRTEAQNRQGPYFNQSKTKAYIIDVSDKQNLKQKRFVEFDGHLISSRRIGNKLYMIMNNMPDIYNIQPLLEKSAEDVGKEMLPTWFDSRTNKKASVAGCADVHFIPRYDDMNFMVIAGINIKNTSASVEKETIMGTGDIVYASLDNLYIAGSRYEYPEEEVFNVWRMPRGQQNTVVYRFALEGGDVTFKTKGQVKGRLLNQFSMDEKGETFRLATTTGEVWNSRSPSQNHLFILDKNDLSQTLGKIENIAPGEKIYSIRFISDRAYMVTFKKVDPFFVIDLQDPAAPKILGELKIPGYSDYLHPFDENHIIGFGKEAVDPTELEREGFNGRDFDFAWYQGMKIALFDVTDVANPKVLFKEMIGDRGTESELLHNHKALLYDRARSLFAFPVTVAEIEDKTVDQYTGPEHGETVFNGAYVYTLDLENGFTLKGKITNHDEAPGPGSFKYDWNMDVKRIVRIGEFLYTIAEGKLKSVGLSDMQEAGSIKFEIPEYQDRVFFDM